MKGFALIVLCALVAVQARHTGVVKSTSTLAALGENPSVLHLRVAVSTSGLLETGGGVLIGSRWILTAASTVQDARFIWVRYGAVDVISPQLVTENSIVIVHPDFNAGTGENNIALININRNVESTDNVAPIGVAAPDTEVTSGKFCSYGITEEGNPGEQLSCAEISVEQDGNSLIATDADESSASNFDLGAPLVSNNELVAILTAEGGVFTEVGKYVAWIEAETGLALNPEDTDGEDNDDDDDAEDGDAEDDDAEDDDAEDDDAEADEARVDPVQFVN